MSFDPKSLSTDDRGALLRWRLALGKDAEATESGFGLGALGESGGASELVGVGAERLADFDKALGFVYGDRKGGSSASRPYVPTWLASLREFFSDNVVALVQKDAIERKGLTELLFEPETMPLLEKNVELVTTLVSARGLIPDKAKNIAREIVREVVEELRKKLAAQVRSAVVGAIRRDKTSPLRVMRNIDWKRTIRQNLKGWDAENERLVPERFYFWGNQKRRNEWDVSILVDQSGSMAESVVYSSVMAAIFASLDVVRTKLLFFDTEVVDMTPVLDDPVEVLFSTQLGGGTDINRAVAYGQKNFVEQPEKTLFILITDLCEGGNEKELLARLRQLVDSRVKVLCLLALSDHGGQPYYDHHLAKTVSELGIPCFGCTPKLLVQVIERIMKNQELGSLVQEAKKKS